MQKIDFCSIRWQAWAGGNRERNQRKFCVALNTSNSVRADFGPVAHPEAGTYNVVPKNTFVDISLKLEFKKKMKRRLLQIPPPFLVAWDLKSGEQRSCQLLI